MSADFKIDKNMQEMTHLLKALDAKIENRSALALTILVGTSLLCVDLLVFTDAISVWRCLARRGQMKMFYHYQKSP